MQRVALFYPDNLTLTFDCPDCLPVVWRGKYVNKNVVIV